MQLTYTILLLFIVPISHILLSPHSYLVEHNEISYLHKTRHPIGTALDRADRNKTTVKNDELVNIQWRRRFFACDLQDS